MSGHVAAVDREIGRLAALTHCAILDTAAEIGFDDLARLAAQICDTPVGLITFVDDTRQFFKARIGFDGGPVAPLDEGFCPIVVRDAATLILSDTSAHPQFANNAAVTQGGVRFYAGVPLITPDGYALGTLSVLDLKPRTLMPKQLAGLHALANQVVAQMELRRALRFAHDESERAEREAARVLKHGRRLELLARISAQLMLASNASELVRDLYASVTAAFRLDVCVAYACQDGGLRLIASIGLTPESMTIVSQLEFGQAICGMVAVSRKAVHITGIQNGDDPRAAFLKRLGLDTYASTPLLAGDELLGTLAFGRKAGSFSAGELEVLHTLVSYTAIALHRLNAAHALAATSRRQAFLVELGDRLRDLGDPRDVMLAAAESLGRHLMVGRVGYAEIDETGHYATVAHDWSNGDMPSFTGRHRLDDFGLKRMTALRAGRSARFDDVLSDRLAVGEDVVRAFDAVGTRAAISVPLVKDGRFAAGFFVHSREPRHWTDEDEALVREVAERIWASVARARAEAALRQAMESLEKQVTERTAALRASKARLRTMFETSQQFQGLLGIDGTLLEVNATALEAIGAKLEDVIGKHVSDTPWFAATPGMPETLRAAVSMAAKGRIARQDILVKLPSGWRSFDFLLRPIRDEHGAIVAIASEAVETTGRRQAEEALRQSQKMEAVGQLTGGIAHDFNNLLQGITGSLDMVQQRIAQGRIGELDRLIVGAMNSANRAAALTHRLLAFSRRQPLDPKPVRANSLIGSMEDLLRRTMGETIQLDLVVAQDLWITLCDPNQLESAVLNLVINARDAMPEGGRLTIETSNAHLDSKSAAQTRGMNDGQYVCICVTDTGAGMAPEVIERAFDPFFTTKPIGQGTGLGLSMIYGFARQSEGYCEIHSKLGWGTTIKLFLPRHQGRAAEDGPLPEPIELHEAEDGDVVLVVEDEPVVRALVVEALRELGYRALEAADGVSGLEVLCSRQRIDLLITDVGLPGLNGRQMADAARDSRPDLKVLFMTGYAETTATASSFLKPGMAMITKPFAMKALTTRIRSMIKADRH